MMDGYVDVKFQAVRLSDSAPPKTAARYEAFSEVCSRLLRRNMTLANGGGTSTRAMETAW